MAEKITVVITGANTGIGFETVKALLRSDKAYHIFLGSRDLTKASQAIQNATTEVGASASSISPLQIDVEDDASIAAAFTAVANQFPRIDVLINNAGAAFDRDIGKGTLTTRQAWNKAWDVNVVGAHIVTETFLPLLLKSTDPRLIFNTSGLSSLTDAADPKNPRYIVPPVGLPKPPSMTGYRASKAGLNMVMLEWTRFLKEDGVKVWCIAPGLLATGLGGDAEVLKRMGAGDPALGGKALAGVVEGNRDADVGRVVREYGATNVQNW